MHLLYQRILGIAILFLLGMLVIVKRVATGSILNANPGTPYLFLDLVELLRKHEKTGRPLGSKAFIKKLETLLGRSLQPQKAGRKKLK